MKNTFYNVNLKRAVYLLLLMLMYQNLGAQIGKDTLAFTIDDILILADNESDIIQLSKLAIDAKKYAVEAAENNRYPDLSFSADAGYLSDAAIIGLDHMPNGVYSNPHFSNNYSLEASWVLYAGGNIKRSIHLAELDQESAKLEYQKTKNDIHLMFVGLFTDLIVSHNQKKVLVKNIEQTHLLLENMANRLKVGTILKSDYIRYELQLSSLKLALTKIENRIKILSNKITEPLNLESNSIIVPISKNENSIADLIGTPLDNNYGIRLSQLSTQQTKKLVDINKANILPSLVLFANSSLNRPFVYDLPPIDIYSNVQIVGVSLNFDIGKLFKNKSHVKQAYTHYKQSQLDLDHQKEETNIAYNEALIQFSESEEQLEVAKKELELATENYRLVINQYNNELALITDVMDASNTKLNAGLKLENAKAAIAFSRYRLKHILGKL